jgi:hypothetical protein
MINTTNIKTNTNTQLSKYLSPGQHKVKITNIIPHQSKTGSYKLKFELETEPVTQEGFIPVEGRYGQIGTVHTVFMSNPDMETQVAQTIASLADTLGVRDAVNALPSDTTYEDWASKLTELVKDQYFWVTLNGKEYINSTSGKKGVELNFPKFRAFASLTKYEEVGAEKALAKVYVKELPKETTTPTSTESLFS